MICMPPGSWYQEEWMWPMPFCWSWFLQLGLLMEVVAVTEVGNAHEFVLPHFAVFAHPTIHIKSWSWSVELLWIQIVILELHLRAQCSWLLSWSKVCTLSEPFYLTWIWIVRMVLNICLKARGGYPPSLNNNPHHDSKVHRMGGGYKWWRHPSSSWSPLWYQFVQVCTEMLFWVVKQLQE